MNKTTLSSLIYTQLRGYYLMDDHYECYLKCKENNVKLPWHFSYDYFSDDTWNRLTDSSCEGYCPYHITIDIDKEGGNENHGTYVRLSGETHEQARKKYAQLVA